MVYDPFNVLMDSLSSIVLRFFCLCSSVILACNFFVCDIFGFVIRVMVVLLNEVGSVPFSAILGKVCEG